MINKIETISGKIVDNRKNSFPGEVISKEFTNSTEVTSLAITKLDGTAKGGVVIGISDEFKIPVKYIGVGEGIDDLQDFNKLEFVDSFFD